MKEKINLFKDLLYGGFDGLKGIEWKDVADFILGITIFGLIIGTFILYFKTGIVLYGWKSIVIALILGMIVKYVLELGYGSLFDDFLSTVIGIVSALVIYLSLVCWPIGLWAVVIFFSVWLKQRKERRIRSS